ncbi:MAG: fibronectin type III-like domain-contianing protein, partial [Thaumarchaeota archaeon]|nr:fibronectin type III-like domain-contianing protein [Nitrososphaerota archaeon]
CSIPPGESRKIIIRIKQSELAVWGADRKWQVEPGTFIVTVGGSSEGLYQWQKVISKANLCGSFTLE